METAIWIVVVVLMLGGLAGTFVPVVPGAPIILVAAVIHKYFLPQYVSVWTLGVLAVLAVVAVLLDMACSIGGAKWYGATSWGLVGSGVGAFIGLWGGPIGLLAGAILGAIVAEIAFAGRPIKEAAKAGLGAGLGLLASTAGRAAICLTMIVAFAVDCFI